MVVRGPDALLQATTSLTDLVEGIKDDSAHLHSLVDSLTFIMVFLDSLVGSDNVGVFRVTARHVECVQVVSRCRDIRSLTKDRSQDAKEDGGEDEKEGEEENGQEYGKDIRPKRVRLST